MADNLIKLKEQQVQLRSLMDRLPKMAGAEAVRFFKSRFREQAWAGDRQEPWPKRKPGSKRNKGRAILKDTGRLQRSIRVASTTPTSVTIATDVPYAKVHNEGFRGTVQVKAHTRNRYEFVKTGTGIFSIRTRNENTRTDKRVKDQGAIQVEAYSRQMNLIRRQFMGRSQYLDIQIKRLITNEINKILK